MAIDFTLELTVARPPGAVFAVLTDPARLHEWQVEVVETEVLGGGALAVGARVREVRRLAGRRAEQVVEVAAFEPPRTFALRIVEGAARIHGDWTLEPDGAGTRLRVRAHGRGPLPLLDPLLSRVARRQLRRQHERLKAIVESA